MEVLLKQSWDEIDAHQWDRLVEESGTRTVFQTHGWHSAWLKHFNDGKELFLITVKQGRQLTGLAPLVIVKKGRLRILKFIGTGHSDYCDFIYKQGETSILPGIFGWLGNNKGLWDAMALDYIPGSSPTVAAMDSLCADNGLFFKQYSQLLSPAIIFDDKDQVVRRLIEKKSLQRHYRHFQGQQGYQVMHLTGREAIDPWLDEFFKQHIKRWEAKKDKSLFRQEANRQFYRSFIAALCGHGQVIFTVIQSQGRPIAFHVGLTYGKKFIWYKPSFDISLSKYSAGEVLLRELIVYAGGHNFDEFDFSIGNEPFKLRFSNQVRQNASFKVFKSKQDRVFDQWLSMLKPWRRGPE